MKKRDPMKEQWIWIIRMDAMGRYYVGQRKHYLYLDRKVMVKSRNYFYTRRAALKALSQFKKLIKTWRHE